MNSLSTFLSLVSGYYVILIGKGELKPRKSSGLGLRENKKGSSRRRIPTSGRSKKASTKANRWRTACHA